MKSHRREHEPADDGAQVSEAEQEAWAARVRAQRKAWLDDAPASRYFAAFR